MKGFVARCIGDRVVAEHVVEEVFVHLWRHPQSFDPAAGSLRSHLVKDGHWRCVGLVSLERSESAQGGRMRPEKRSDDRAQRRSDGPDHLGPGGAWHALRLDERVAIGLVQFGEMTTAEIAALLAVDEHTVHARLTRGLQQLAAAGGTS